MLTQLCYYKTFRGTVPNLLDSLVAAQSGFSHTHAANIGCKFYNLGLYFVTLMKKTLKRKDGI